ncbi:MAG: glycoside hydrolase family 140 protein, partial [Treponema sp.]|nr:glycoside hydrolase family 140 protein [Treponema sp.]
KFNRAWGKGPEIFNVENAYIYGKWLASRYRDRWNIIWMLGGDRPLEPVHRKIIDAMAAGIREQDQQHLITFHPQGRKQSTTCVGDAPYIDFHTAQSGHTTGKSYLSSDLVMLDMASKTGKPYMDSEPRYEDHPAKDNNGRWDEKLGVYWKTAEVRQNAYWNLMAGVCGHTYGNHCIWSMNRIPTGYFPYAWQEALTHDGAEQMGFVKKLRMSRDYFSLRPAPELLAENFAGMGHMAAAMGDGYAYIYSPLGVPFTVNLDPFDKYDAVRALWFDPRRGSEETITLLPAGGQTLMAPPSQGKGCDWVLVLDTSE